MLLPVYNTAAKIRDDLDHVLHFATVITRLANCIVISNTSVAERGIDSWKIPTYSLFSTASGETNWIVKPNTFLKLYFITFQSLTSIQYLHLSYSRSMSVTKKRKIDKWKERRTLGLLVKSLSYIARFLWAAKKPIFCCLFLYCCGLFSDDHLSCIFDRKPICPNNFLYFLLASTTKLFTHTHKKKVNSNTLSI